MNLLRAILLASLAVTASGAEPLHVRIDRLVDGGQVGALAAKATDAEFVRRVYLDLTGRIPSSVEARAFLDNNAATKRRELIDRLLASPEYARHLAVSFDVSLMDRRADKHVKTPEWRQYLFDSFAANKPWDKLAGEMFISDGDKNATTAKAPRAAAKFIMDRDMEVNLVTRDMARKFFGMDLQCAQCHDHPNIADFYQRDYYGIYAFLSRTYIFQPDKKKPALLAERPTGEVSFKSVFTSVSGRTRPRLPVGREVTEPVIKPGEEYTVKPNPKNKNQRPIPKYSRRGRLAELAADNRMFQRNIANRLWGHMMGRAVVEPRDGLHTDNPAAHPALLEVLTDGLVEMKFDMRAFLREVALTKAYQRSSMLPDGLATPDVAALQEEFKKQSAVADGVQAEFDRAKEALDKARGGRLSANAEIGKAKKAVPAVKKAFDATVKPLADAQKVLADKQAQHKPVAAAVGPAKAAADAVKDNKELAIAYAKIKAEADKLATAVAAVQENVTVKTAANKVAEDKLAAAEKSVTDAQAKWAAADKQVQAGDTTWIAASAERDQAKATASHAMRRWEDAQALAEMAEARKVSAVAQKALAAREQDLKSAQALMAAVAGELPPRQATMAVAQKANAAAVAALDSQQKLVNEKSVHAKAAADAVAQSLESGKLTAEALALAAKRNDAEGQALKAKLTAAKARADEAAAKSRVVDALFKKDLAALASALVQRQSAAKDAAGKLDVVQKAVAAVQSRIASAKKRTDTAQAKVALSAAAFQETGARVDKAVAAVTGRWSRNVATGAFTHLTPEQLCWSMMEATGQVAAQRAAAAADFDKKNPPKESTKEDATRTAARAKHVEKFVYDKLKGNVGAFIKLFGGAAGEPQSDFYATADQALFFANGGTVRGWLGTLAGRLAKEGEPKALAEELYLTVLTRRPTAEESALVVKSLAVDAKEKPAVIQDIAWGLLTSAEFRFNH
jgi:hypothetical protein